jgi:hypothetical protein
MFKPKLRLNSSRGKKNMTIQYTTQKITYNVVVITDDTHSNTIKYDNLAFDLATIPPYLAVILNKFNDITVNVNCNTPCDLDEVSRLATNLLIQNCRDLSHVLTPLFQAKIGKTLCCEAKKRVTISESFNSAYHVLDGLTYVEGIIMPVLESLGYAQGHPLHPNLYYNKSKTPLLFPQNQSFYDFFLGENTYVFQATSAELNACPNELKQLKLFQLLTTTKLTLNNYSLSSNDHAEKYVSEIKAIRDSFEHSLTS